MLDFGSRLKELRKAHGMTQKDLADKIGVTKSVISYYELQERSPSPYALIKLAHVFHVSTDYLLGVTSAHALDVSKLSNEEIRIVNDIIEAFEKNK